MFHFPALFKMVLSLGGYSIGGFLLLSSGFLVTTADPSPARSLVCKCDNALEFERFPSLFLNCTHLVYSFIPAERFINPDNFQMAKDFMEKILRNREPYLKVLLAVRDTGVLKSSGDRWIFTMNVTRFMLDTHLDGLVYNVVSFHNDYIMETQKHLIKILKEHMNDDLLLFLQISMTHLGDYPISEIKDYVDFLLVDSQYDERTPFLLTSPMSPLRSKYESLNTIESSLSYILDEGIASRKLIMPLAFSGRVQFISEKSMGVFGEKIKTNAGAIVVYREICPLVKNGTRYWDEISKTPLLALEHCFPRISCKSEFSVVSYDDSQSLEKKVQYGKKLQIGGFYVRNIFNDDTAGECGEGKQPLLNAIIAEAHRPPGVATGYSHVLACSFLGTTYEELKNASLKNCTHFLPEFDKKYSHTIYSGGKGNYTPQEYYNIISSKKENNPNLKILPVIPASDVHHLLRLSSTSIRRSNIVSNIKDFIREHGYNGLGLHWKYSFHQETMEKLVKELWQEFERANWSLIIMFSLGQITSDSIRRIRDDVTFLTPLYYNMGSDNYTRPMYPLFSNSTSDATVENVIQHLLDLGIDSSKILLSLGFLGREFTLPNKANARFGVPSISNRFLSYSRYCTEMNDWDTHWDEITKTAFSTKDNKLVTYEDTFGIIEKMKFLKRKKFGGVHIANIHHDDAEGICGEGKAPLSTTLLSLIGDVP